MENKPSAAHKTPGDDPSCPQFVCENRNAHLPPLSQTANTKGDMPWGVHDLREQLAAEHKTALTWHRQNMALATRNVELKEELYEARKDRDEYYQNWQASRQYEKARLNGLNAAESALKAANDVILAQTIKLAALAPAPSKEEGKPQADADCNDGSWR